MTLFNPIRLIEPDNMGDITEQYAETSIGEYHGYGIAKRTYHTGILEFAGVEYWMKLVFYTGRTLNPGYLKVLLFTENVKYYCMFDGANTSFKAVYASGALQGTISTVANGVPVSFPIPSNLVPVSYDLIYNMSLPQEPFNEQIFPRTTQDDAEYDLMMLAMK